MGLYEAVKDIAKLAQQADNIDLYRKLLDLGAQALEMQAEISKLKEDNARLKRKQDLSSSIQRHKESFNHRRGRIDVAILFALLGY